MTVLPTVRRQIELAAQHAATQPTRSHGRIRLSAGTALAAGSVIITLAVAAAAIGLLGHSHRQITQRVPAIAAPNPYALGSAGIGRARFGQPPQTVARELEPLLGTPASGASGRAVRGICSSEQVIWSGLASRLHRSPSFGLTAYFKHHRFVGYSYGPPYAAPGTRVVRRGPILVTVRGLSLGDTISRARRLYGKAFRVTDQPQGTPTKPHLGSLPAWVAQTGTGTVFGFRSRPGQTNSTTLIESISAGDIPNTPCR
jgi:hypothetical protein